MIIKYKLFKNSKEFENFQNKNSINIIQIQPYLGSIDIKSDDKFLAMATGTTEVSVFVVYTEKEEKQEKV